MAKEDLTKRCEMLWAMTRRLPVVLIVTLVSVCSLHAQSVSPAGPVTPPKAIFTPKPEYRPESGKQGLSGKGVVLVTIDKQTGKVTGAQMLQSTGGRQLDGSALEAYSRWRFDPGTVIVSQLKIPIEFANRPKSQIPKLTLPQSAIFYPLLIVVGLALMMAILKRSKI
jgi:TonB family protein